MPDQPADTATSNDEEASRKAAGLGPVLREQASKLADRSKDAGVETAEAVGKAADRAARELEDDAPELANYVREAANYTQRLAHDLRERSASDLLTEAVDWGRKQPVIALAGAALLGFALSRVIRTGLPASGGPSERHDR
jgi:hypothetical protein